VHAFSDNRQPVSLFTETGCFALKQGNKGNRSKGRGLEPLGTFELEKVVIGSSNTILSGFIIGRKERI
jgi:hypothetical protein